MDTDAYLDRLGAPGDSAVDVETLTRLVARHVETVPFENLSVHLREPIRLDTEALFDKIVRRRRGGICYELNTAFADLLGALGYDVTLVGCKVSNGDGLTMILDHVALLVALDGRRWLVDVGFGRFALRPLDIDVVGEQLDPDGTYTLMRTPDGDVDVSRDGTLVYRVELHPRTRADLRPGAWYHATSPDSPFTASLTCSQTHDGGRVTLGGDRLIRTAPDGSRHEETLAPDAVLDAYRRWFGIELDEVPSVLYPGS